MNAENQKLRDMLSHVSNNYSALQMHLVTLMQQQRNQGTESTQEHEVINIRSFHMYIYNISVNSKS